LGERSFRQTPKNKQGTNQGKGADQAKKWKIMMKKSKNGDLRNKNGNIRPLGEMGKIRGFWKCGSAVPGIPRLSQLQLRTACMNSFLLNGPTMGATWAPGDPGSGQGLTSIVLVSLGKLEVIGVIQV